ncbi:MAG: ABC transporter permease subunit [Verrucomicrobia bacterium]|nr:ABC transporter permease subunit [Verrucomicrobiota bacterium]
MTILPVVARELRVAARRRATYWARFSAALAAILVAAWIWLVSQGAPPATVAQTLFVSISGLVFGFCLLAGTRHTADCISAEKREGTLGLLFLTDLKGFDVVLGKLVASSISSFYAVLAVFPLLGIPLLMGGVQPMAFAQMTAVLANTLFLSLAAGVLVSSVSRDSRRAVAGAFLLILLVVAGWPFLGAAFLEYALKLPLSSATFSIFYVPSPGFAFSTTWASAVTAKLHPHFWLSILTTHMLAWLFLALASWIVPRCWQDRPSATANVRWRDRLRAWKFGTATERAALRRRLLEINPFLWLAGRDRFKSFLVWLLLLGFAGAWGVWYLNNRTTAASIETGVVFAFLLHCALKFWIGSEASRHLVELRRSGALEHLLSTPLSVPEILRGHLLALARQFGGPIVAALVADLLVLGLNREFNQETILLFAAGMSALVLDAYALAWLGMWHGLSAKNFNRASGAALTRVLALPWVIFFVVLATFSAIPRLPNMGWAINHGLGFWCVITIGVDLFYILRSRTKLLTQFRNLATQPTTEVESRFFRSARLERRNVLVPVQDREARG